MASRDPLIGKTIGNYRILACLGKGGMGAVYLGEHPEIHSRVAIKVLLPEVSSNEVVVNRFLDEARAVNRIGHPGIVRIHDCDRTAGVGTFLIMELLEGKTLEEVNAEGPPLTAAEVGQVVQQTATALSASHAAGIVHRDLKPANIFLVPDQDMPAGVRVRVLDFGIAKLLVENTATSGSTRTGVAIGTPLYMSPEQCLDAKTVDHRTDIYALGVVAYELLCGRLPYVAASLGKLVLKHREGRFRPLPLDPKRTSESMSAVVTRALARLPEHRFQNMGELREAMVEAVAEVGPPLDQRLMERARRTIELQAPWPSIEDDETLLPDGDHGGDTGESLASAETELPETLLNTTKQQPAGLKATTVSGSGGETASRPRAARSRLRGAAAGLVVAVLVAVIGLYLGGSGAGDAGRRQPASDPPRRLVAAASPDIGLSPNTRASVPDAADNESTPPAPPSVAIALDVTPPTAFVTVDGQPVADNPLKLPQSGQQHIITFDAEGYDGETRRVMADANQTVVVKLVRSSAGSAKAAGRRPRSRAVRPRVDKPNRQNAPAKRPPAGEIAPRSSPTEQKKKDPLVFDKL